MQKRYLILLPIAGIGCFFGLYGVAALLYPGGSQHDTKALGFSWRHNYWCNLLNETGMNGHPNPGQPFALAAMIVLSFSLGLFWFSLPRLISTGFVPRAAVHLSGMLVLIPFIFIPWVGHDIMIYLSGLVATIAMTGTLTALFLQKWYRLFTLGIFCVLLMIVNNIFYHTISLLRYLPIVQKISFVVFLGWICFVALKLYHLARRHTSTKK
ncbi:MAG: hypothetical protein V4725_10910 [Bacteroidota bacterium]